MKLNRYLYMLMFLLAFVISTDSVAAEKGDMNSKSNSKINCAIQDGPCIQEMYGHEVTLEVLPRPVKAMTDLTFKVTLDSEYTMKLNQQPHIDLNMPAMNMGKNRVLLKSSDKASFEGTGVIVRCKSGRRTWKATVTFPEIGKCDFIFDVIY